MPPNRAVPSSTDAKSAPRIPLQSRSDCRILFEVASLQIPSHRRQFNSQSVELLRHGDLAPQPTCLGKPERQVQHIVLVIFGFGHLVVVFMVEHDDVARRARTRSSACAFHLEIVRLGYVEEVVALGNGDLVLLAFLVEKCDV